MVSDIMEREMEETKEYSENWNKKNQLLEKNERKKKEKNKRNRRPRQRQRRK